ncbi:hypothetical protein KIW84_058111 [Lathyrus oleraceus]|uniref:Uncharacterized protein n=1 Tax=Pisum sativum TaxID=3888 RepID=A0A9D4X809_PEA|nr:hypothetical protein KIW84_058111 [Pisum sativum]
MVSDSDDDKVYQYAMVMKYAVHIYVEHKGNENDEEADVGDFQEENVGGVEQVGEHNVGGVEQVEKENVGGIEHVKEANVGDVEQVEEANVGGVEQVEDTEDNDDGDFEPAGLSFDDSEDERALGLDNFFDFIENQVEENGKIGRIKFVARKHKHTPKKVPIGVDNVGSCSGMDNEMIINYASDELGSSAPDASDGEKEPKYPRFKMQDLDKNYKFKVGLKFISLEEFKEAIKPKKTTIRQGPTQTATQEQTQPTKAETATQEQPQPNETQIDVDPEFEMLAANLATTFEATQTQPNLVVNGPVTSTSSHNAPVTSAQGELVTSSQTDDVPDYILSVLVPTTDDVPAAPAYTTSIVLKPVESNIPFHNDLKLFY